jgi:multiple sugar transport system permease protein
MSFLKKRSFISAAYLYLLPALLLFLIFKFYPISLAIRWSFTDLSLLESAQAQNVGVDNYKKILSDSKIGLSAHSRDEWSAMFSPAPLEKKSTVLRWLTLDWPRGAISNTIKFCVLFLPPYIIIPLLIAWMLELVPRGETFFRTLIFLPVVISTGVASVIWLLMYNPNYGILNRILSPLGVQPHWLADPLWAMPAIAIMCLWSGMGLNVIFFQVGFSRIGTQIFEAAQIDGANSFQTFFKVALPLLRPSIYFVSLISLISSLKIFAPMWIMTKGGPEESTMSYVMYLYRVAFEPSRDFEFGYASALAISFAVFLFILTAATQRLNRSRAE